MERAPPRPSSLLAHPAAPADSVWGRVARGWGCWLGGSWIYYGAWCGPDTGLMNVNGLAARPA
eukprot:scaffold72627_cov18-Tisochrysis_lutea.AAC.1